MRHLALVAGVLALSVLEPASSTASDLGISGPFRWIGGAACPSGAPDGCAPPPVDPALPLLQQVSHHIERALAFLDLVRLGDSRAALDEALRLDPDNVRALALRGRLSLTESHPDAALPDIEHAFRLSPNDPDLLATLAVLSPPDQALRDLDTALALKPDNIDALLARARVHLGFFDLDAALTDLNRSLVVRPDDPRARLLRAQVHLQRHAFDLAVLDVDKALAIHPRDLDALQVKAASRLGAGDEAGAIDAYTELLGGPDDTRPLWTPQAHGALVGRGRLYAKQRRFAEARQDLDTLLGQRGVQALLRLQLYLRGHGYPNVEISGHHTMAFDAAIDACFSDTVCGPNLFP